MSGSHVGFAGCSERSPDKHPTSLFSRQHDRVAVSDNTSGSVDLIRTGRNKVKRRISMGVRTTGCHHMAFVTNNMDATVKFYNGLLGFPVVVTLQLPNPDP